MSRARSVLLLAGFFFAAQTAFAAGISIRGRVLDAAGAPLAKARVRLVPLVSTHAAGRLELEGKDGPEAVASAESGADGFFRLEAPEPGMWKVIVSGDQLVPQEAPAAPLISELDLPTVRLQRDTGLTVRVLGPDGRPVPGARVQGEPAPSLSPVWQNVQRLAVTDAEGRAVLPRAGSTAMTVRAGASGFATAERRDVRTKSVDLRLAAGPARPLRVLGADGKPAAGVLVHRDGGGFLGLTGADGLFDLVAPGGEPVDVLLIAADGRRIEARVRPVPAKEPRSPQLPQDIRLPAAVETAVQVVSAADGRPLAGALVWSMADPGDVRRTDARGTTRLVVTAQGAVGVPAAIQGAAVGYSVEAVDARVSAERPRGSVVLSLQPDLALTGVVVDEAGAPVTGAEISPSAGYRPGLPIPVMMRIFQNRGSVVRSGPGGRFRLGGMVEGVEYELRVTKDGFAPARIDAMLPEPERPASPLRIVLRRGGSAFGRVLGADQRPVAGAQVTLRASVAAGPDRFRAALKPESQDAFEAVTGADGRFDLPHLPAGRYDLTARGRGWAPLTVPTLEIPEGNRATDLGTLVLAPGVAVEGTVVDTAGKPVEGAAVHVTEAVDSSFPFPLPTREEEPATLSGADGFFRIEDLRAGSTVNLSAQRMGYAAGEARGIQVPAEQPVRIALQGVGAISGRVVDPDGRPVAGASVHVDMRPGTSRFLRTSSAPMMDRSGDDGSFRIAEVVPGPVGLVAQASGWQTGTVAGLELRSGEEKRGVEIVLSPAAVLEGRVLAPSGRAVPHAQVQLSPDDRQSGFHSASTDAGGRYVLDSLAPGLRTVEATHPDYGTARRQVEIRVGDNSFDITLQAGNEVSGRVVDEDGAPVAGARILLGGRGALPVSATSQVDGGFRFAAVADGNYHAMAEKEGFSRSQRVPVTVSGDLEGLELRLTRGGSIAGRIAGVEASELSRVQIVAWGAGMPAGGRVGPDGSYRIDHIGAGQWRVRAELPGTALYAEGEVQLEPGAAEARLDLEMERGYELSGRVRRNGAPASGETLFLAGPGQRHAIAETDANGRFRFSGLAAGSYHVQLGGSGGSRHEETVDLQADRDITIDLAAGEVSGRVVDAADGSPLANVLVHLVAADGESIVGQERTDSRGVFLLREVADGSWRVRAQADGYAPAETAVSMDGAGPSGEVELSLRATEGVTLQVTAAAGPPSSVFYVVLDGAGRKVGDGTATVGEAGRVRLSRVPPGSWQVLLQTESTAATEITVTSPGDAGPVTLPPPCTLQITVRPLEEAAVPATVRLIGAGGRPYRNFARIFEPAADWTLSRGTLVLRDVPPGTWEVWVTAADGRSWQTTATTTPGAPAQAVME